MTEKSARKFLLRLYRRLAAQIGWNSALSSYHYIGVGHMLNRSPDRLGGRQNVVHLIWRALHQHGAIMDDIELTDDIECLADIMIGDQNADSMVF